MTARNTALSGVLFSVFAAQTANAQQPLSDESPSVNGATLIADTLFDEAQSLMAEGRYNEACARFGRSQKIQAAVGTLLNLAVCYEKAGRYASAWSTYRDAAAAARHEAQTERADFADRRAVEIKPKVARVAIMTNVKLPSLIVTMNGVVVPAEALNQPLPVDAGETKLEATLNGRRWTTQVAVSLERSPVIVEIPSRALGLSERSEPSVTSTRPEPIVGWRQQHTAYVIGGLGAIGLGIGSFFGIKAASLHGDSKQHCLPENEDVCERSGIALRDDARRAGNVSTGLFLGGGVLVAAGVTVYLLRPSASAPAPLSMTVNGTTSRLALVLKGAY